MKFHKRSLKLAGIYLAILMSISLFFSATVYQQSLQEVRRGLRDFGPEAVVNRLDNAIITRYQLEEIVQQRDALYEQAKHRILNRLILINLAILVGGGMLSYYYALRTLRPIEEAHEQQSRFTADASHELRTPLAAMKSETEVALMDPKLTLAKSKAILRSNIEELDKLTALSDGLLRLARSENTDLPMAKVSLDRVVQRSIDRILPVAEAKNILITHKFPKDTNVSGDEDSLVESLVILLDNAIKYSPPKTEVKVLVRRDQKQVTIKVIDKGMGIKAAQIPHIFDRFYRADSARSKQNVSGYGIGLAIAKSIIDKHNGEISVESKPSKGSTFSIKLQRA